ncbi:13089_t:CDS:2 [Dentiscutata erythropus]|uniref:13089_t:CDS:1 n=1 Tax=Dentiscutata erythropus TaxID=1348616 RepID=A0A9N9IIW7_9GLOM|nr:13089_t:CDS:2 [Dentiscutata erythropus]
MTPENFFMFIPCDFWSLENFIAFSIGNDESADKENIHRIYYTSLRKISDDTKSSQEVRDRAGKLLDNKKTDCKIVAEIWYNINEQRLKVELSERTYALGLIFHHC